jgi:hypothetical protein
MTAFIVCHFIVDPESFSWPHIPAVHKIAKSFILTSPSFVETIPTALVRVL